MPHREPYDPKRPLVAAREFIFAGRAFKKGDPFPTEGFARRLIDRQYDCRAVEHAAPGVEDDSPIKMVPGPSNGRYTITAPWLETPLIIRGKKNANQAFADMTEEGPPEGWEPAGEGDGEAGEGQEAGEGNSVQSETDNGAGGAGDGDEGPTDAENEEGADSDAQGEEAAPGDDSSAS